MSLATHVLKVADVSIGRAICLLFGRRRTATPRAGADPPAQVLVIRPGGIGDAVLFVPMLRALREHWPRARFDVLLERRNAQVLAGTGLADRILRYDVPGELARVLATRYDLVIDTEQYHCLSAVVARATRAPRRIGFGTNVRRRMLTDAVAYDQERYEVLSFLELAERATGSRVAWDPDRPFYPLDESARRFAREALAPLAGMRTVAIHPGASIPERRWPPERYGQLAAMLAERGHGVVVLGGPTDRRAAAVVMRALEGLPAVDLAGRCTLPQAAAVVAEVEVYVSADTGVLHLAYGVGTPTVHLFGPGVLSKWGPPGRAFRTVRNPTPCSPCTRYGYTPPCCQGMICMLGITPEQVAAAVLERLDRTRAEADHG